MLKTIALGVIGIGVGAVLAGGAAAFMGTPSACVSRAVLPSAAAGRQLSTNWDAFKQQAARGSATLVVTEEQATSKAADWLKQQDAPLRDVQIYFCPDGRADVSATLTSFGAPVRMVISGGLDVSGGEPRVRIDAVRVGSLPGALGASLANSAISAANVRSLPLQGLKAVQFTDGKVTLTGGR